MSVFLLSLAVCMLDLLLEPTDRGPFDFLGVTAHPGIGVRPVVLIWCLAVPMVLVGLLASRRHRRKVIRLMYASEAPRGTRAGDG